MIRKILKGDQCMCPTCGEYFKSTYAFDAHRVGTFRPLNRRCLTTEEMQTKGFNINKYGFWLSPAKGLRAQERRSWGELSVPPLTEIAANSSVQQVYTA